MPSFYLSTPTRAAPIPTFPCKGEGATVARAAALRYFAGFFNLLKSTACPAGCTKLLFDIGWFTSVS